MLKHPEAILEEFFKNPCMVFKESFINPSGIFKVDSKQDVALGLSSQELLQTLDELATLPMEDLEATKIGITLTNLGKDSYILLHAV